MFRPPRAQRVPARALAACPVLQPGAMRVRTTGLALSLLLIAAASLGSEAVRAAPVITVRGEATLQLRQLVRLEGVTRLAGSLRDATTQQPLVNRRVRVRIDVASTRHRSVARTDQAGAFRVQLRTSGAVHLLALSFEGDTLYAATTLPPRMVDVSKPTVALRLQMPPRLDASKREQRLEVEALVGDQRVALPITLHLREPSPKLLARARTQAKAAVRLTLPTASLGRPGAKDLSLRFAGDQRFNAAQLRITTTLTTPVTIRLRAARSRVAADGRIALTGDVRDVLGPIKRAAISLQAMGRHAAAAATRDDGSFSVELDAQRFPPGPLDLRAVLAPSVSWRQPGASKTLSVLIEPPKPIPARLYVIPAAVTALVLLLVLGWRIRGRFARTAADADEAHVEALSADDRPPPALRSGLTTAKKQRLRRQDFGLDGKVWDPVDARPIARATITLRDGDDQRHTLQSDELGRFTVEDLAAGPLALEASCPGYVTERAQLELPHRGSLRGMRIDLVPVRVRILEIYRQVALDLLPKPRLWARWTPRDLLAHVRRRAEVDPALDELSELLERVYWSDAVPDEDDLRRARALADVTARAG
jgi:hypothetical protein